MMMPLLPLIGKSGWRDLLRMISLREMAESDLPFADWLRSSAGWNQTLEDWRRWLVLSPHGCFLAEWNGAPAGTASTICHGQELAWIGMLLVHPDFRRRGIGRALLNRCLELFHERGIECIKLDATPQGKLLYDQLGFQQECFLTRWEIQGFQRPAPAPNGAIRGFVPSEANSVDSLDQKAFGVSRSALLQTLFGGCCRALVHHADEGMAGYGVLRAGARAHYVGPLIAASPISAALLASALLDSAFGRTIFWDIPDANAEAVALARSFGFLPQRHFVRMFLGKNQCAGDPSQVFAIADPATG